MSVFAPDAARTVLPPASLLDVMDGIPGGDGIEFEPPFLTVKFEAAQFE